MIGSWKSSKSWENAFLRVLFLVSVWAAFSSCARAFEIQVAAPGPDRYADADLQAAIDKAAAQGGGFVTLGTGEFKLSRTAGDETLVIKSGITLRGQGYATHIYFDPKTPPNPLRYFPVRIGDSKTPADNVVIENLRYTAHDSAIGGGSIMGFNARLDAPESLLLSCDNITIRNCWIYDAKQAAGCTKPAAPMYNARHVISPKEAEEASRLGPTRHFYTADDRLLSQFKNWQVYGNTIDTCGNKAIELAECNGGLIADNYITNVHAGPQVIFGSRNVDIRDNIVYFTGSGINITEGSHHIRVRGNHVEPAPSAKRVTGDGCLHFRTEPLPLDSKISQVVVTGNIFRNQATKPRRTVRFQTRKEAVHCTYESIVFTGNLFDGDVSFVDLTSPAKTTIQDVLFADNICEGDIHSATSATMRSRHVAVRGNTFRKDGAVVLNADHWVWSGNTHAASSLLIAGGAFGNVVQGNVTAEQIQDMGIQTTLANNVILAAKKSETATAKSQSFDLVVVGGTPGGIACAVRAAREGLSVLLVNRHEHLGGIMSSGLGVWDTQWEGKRSPVYDEVRAAFFAHYREAYGEDSPQYRDALPGKSGHTNGRYEPHVAEKILTGLVAREKNITVLKGFIPVEVGRDGALLKSVTLRAANGADERIVQAPTFADCTYEGDLAALAKAPYRIAREARGEFNEPHAGLIFMRPVTQAPDAETARIAGLHDALKLRKFSGFQEILKPQSTGAADDAVQACNYRTILTADPANRTPILKPANYDPYFLKSLEIFSGVESIPNGKFGWNRPQIVGRQTAYVEATWDERQRLMDEHWESTLGLLYFLQNDPTVPEKVRRAWLEYGLAKDEFADNGHRPYEMYVRETRRIKGRAIYTQHDAMLALGLLRAPIHADSIAMTEWYMDSHSCTPARIAGVLEEGKVMLHQETFPGQLPYRCLLPQGVDNLLVPVCLSATHVSWGTVRLEPVFMQTGESAGLAAALAFKSKTPPAQLDADQLVRALCKRGSMVSFFNDVEVSKDDPRSAAAQYFGTKGFFSSYDAKLDAPLTESVRTAWQAGFAMLQQGSLDPMQFVKTVHVVEEQKSPNTNGTRGEALLSLWSKLDAK